MTPAEAALSWVGKDFRPGQKEQCAQFVRAMFAQAGEVVGVAARPSDMHLIPGEPQGPGYANSFAGDDVGEKVSSVGRLQPGDVVMFRNTYGDYPFGVITHVGIYTGGGYMVHRPTAARPVERVALAGYWEDLFVEGRRVGTRTAKPKVRLKVYGHSGRRTLVLNEDLKAGEYELVADEGWMEVQR